MSALRRTALALVLPALLWPAAAAPAAPARTGDDEPPRLGVVYERQILNALLEAKDAVLPRRRNERAFVRLVAGRTEVVAAALRRRLRDPKRPADRRAAVRGLGFLRRPADSAACAAALAGDPDAPVRRSAAVALGRIGGETARRALTRAAGADADTDVRVEACNALYLTGNPAVPWIMARLARRATGTVAGVLDGWRGVFRITPEEWAVLGRPAPAARRDPHTVVERWIGDAADSGQLPQPWDALHQCLHGDAAVAGALTDAVDAPDAAAAERARRALWLRELEQEGLAAQRADAIAGAVPQALADLEGPAPGRRTAAHRWLVWLSGRDLGPAAAPWRSWWVSVRDTLRPPPAGEPPRPTLAAVRSR